MFGWRIVQLKPYGEITEGLPSIFAMIIIVGLICFIIAVLFLIYFSKNFLVPVKKLIKQMDIVSRGQFDIEIDESYINEIGDLNHKFRFMTNEIKNLLNRVERENKLKRDAEFKALQYQINPHFLYNTLDSINWMAIKIKAHDISQMVSDLGMFFRLGISNGINLVSIKDEIEHLRYYIKIQKVRFNHKFKYIEDIEPELFDCAILKLTIQPIVENSLLHGFVNMAGQGEIHIDGRSNGRDIFFEIRDDGSGVDVEYMNRYIGFDMSEKKGYGVRNVDQRIKMYFGQKYGLTYLPSQKGTIVQIKIPLINKVKGDTYA